MKRLYSAMLHDVVWYKLTDVSGVITVAIIRSIVILKFNDGYKCLVCLVECFTVWYAKL
jgi:hypothetical protein